MTNEFKINLQLFADGDIEETADLTEDVNTEEQSVVDDGDTQPDLTDDTSQEQSKDKDNPANHAFAEMRRKNKELETQVQKLTQQQKEKDDYYANLAKQSGRTDITTEEQYRKAVKLENLSNQYKETQDPLILAEIIKETTAQPVKQETYIDNHLERLFENDIEDYNKEFKGNLKGLDDILTLPNNEKIIGYMQNNNLSLTEAYKLANPDKIAAATKQAAINQARGHAHVNANSNGGTVDTTVVTAADIANWKQWFPGKTDEQCRKEIISSKKILTD